MKRLLVFLDRLLFYVLVRLRAIFWRKNKTEEQDLSHYRIGILMGGESFDRETSLFYGREVVKTLLKLGYNAKPIFVNSDPNIINKLKRERINLAFITLNMGFQKEGSIQALLEMIDIPYTGPNLLSSSLCLNKLLAKKIFMQEGIPTPNFLVYNRSETGAFMEEAEKKIKFPVVVKPVNGATSLGVSFVNTPQELYPAISTAEKYDKDIFIEEYLSGLELTVGVLGNDDPMPLPVMIRESDSRIISFHHKLSMFAKFDTYHANNIPESEYKLVQKLALKAHKALYCSGLTRVDFRLNHKGQPFVLEVNAIPIALRGCGLVESAAICGISYEELLITMLKLALKK